MRTIYVTWSLFLSASACNFSDQLDRAIEQKVEQLSTVVAKEPPAPEEAPAAPPVPEPAPVPEPPPAPAVEPPPSPRGRPVLKLGNMDVRGALSAKDLRSVLERHSNELRLCYEQTLAGNTTVVIKFVVSPTGSVQVASVERSDSGIEQLDMCLTHAVRRRTFPAPKGGGIAVVTLPIQLSRAPISENP